MKLQSKTIEAEPGIVNLIFADQTFLVLPLGVLYWPATDTLIASDLHLEKGSAQARRGYFLPPYDSRETLSRLLVAIRTTKARRLLLLGDCFHDVHGYARLGLEEKGLFQDLLAYDPIWIVGNHDGDFVPPGFSAHVSYEWRGITFRHEAVVGAENEISGHFHPVANLVHKGAKLRRRCLVADASKILMPAIGAYAGGLSVTDAAIRKHFPNGGQLHVLGNARVFTLAYT